MRRSNGFGRVSLCVSVTLQRLKETERDLTLNTL